MLKLSTVGLTIAKDCARLASDIANELIFLHDALPQFNEAQRLLVIMVLMAWPMGEALELLLVVAGSFLAAPGLIINNPFFLNCHYQFIRN